MGCLLRFRRGVGGSEIDVNDFVGKRVDNGDEILDSYRGFSSKS